jgi:hypothetical protein
MKSQYSLIAAITVAFYIGASFFGYSQYLANPQGVLLYTPPAHGSIHYTPAFAVGFSLMLFVSCISAIGVAFLAILSRFFLAPEHLRANALSTFKGGLLVALFCLPGIFLSESIWRVFHP